MQDIPAEEHVGIPSTQALETINLHKTIIMPTHLIENSSELLERQDAQRVGGDGDYALGALLRREARGILESLVGERRQMEPVLVVVAQPRPARHGQHLQPTTNGYQTTGNNNNNPMVKLCTEKLNLAPSKMSLAQDGFLSHSLK